MCEWLSVNKLMINNFFDIQSRKSIAVKILQF